MLSNNRFFLILILLFLSSINDIRSHNDINGQISLQSSKGEVQAVLYNSNSYINTSQVLKNLMNGISVVFYGYNSHIINELFKTELIIRNNTKINPMVVSGIRLQKEGTTYIEHQIQIYDLSFNKKVLNSLSLWLNDTTQISTPPGYKIIGLITQIDHHEPYGKLETKTEVLKILDYNNEHEWYDVSVTQCLTPGVNYTSSKWEWNWLQYTMNGSLDSSNVFLSEYDSPPKNELPSGLFSFLWRILGFDLREYLPWLSYSEPKVRGIDMSDFKLELFRVRYETPIGYKYKDKPMEIRHHYVIRVEENSNLRFWHQTQVQYTQSETYAQLAYITPPLTSGYIVKISSE